jgi:serine protease Do
MSDLLQRFSHDMASVSEIALRSLVQIRNGRQGVGAGAIWHADGLVVTNYHVIEGASGRPRDRFRRQAGLGDSLAVILPDGTELPATVLAHDPGYDLAALRVQASGLPAIELGDSRQVRPGQFVLALGFPWGVSGGATSGVVIGVGANLPEASGDNREWLAASLHLRPGHSGGPMVDSQGRLIGINTMMNGPDVGVAVPVHLAKAFLRSAYDRQVEGRVVHV